MYNSHLKSCHCFHRGLKFSTYVLCNIYCVENIWAYDDINLSNFNVFANGLDECYNQTLQNMLAEYIYQKRKNGVITLIHCVCLQHIKARGNKA